MATKILKNPPELERLYKIRARLSGTDRDDHVRELEVWERKIKKALILLNLKGHEGVGMLIEKADEEIKQVDEVLTRTRPTDLGTEGAIKYANETARLFDKKELWEWFKGLFDEADADLNDAKGFLTEQEAPTEDDDYQGGEKPVL